MHNYQRELDKLIKAGKVGAEPGEVSMLDITHDRWCGIYTRDLCNCNPEISKNGVVLNPSKSKKGKR